MLHPLRSFAFIVLIASAVPIGIAPAFAQASTNPALPEAQLRTAQRLDKLFERLGEAADAQAARGIANEIERIFERSGSETADLMYQRAKTAMEAKEFDLALDLLDFVVTLKPDWAEAYHRRAIVHFIRKDEDAAMRDVRAALAREPRHYHALAGLGGLLRGMGNVKGAYKAFTRALEIYPHMGDLKDSVEKMKPEAEGQPI